MAPHKSGLSLDPPGPCSESSLLYVDLVLPVFVSVLVVRSVTSWTTLAHFPSVPFVSAFLHPSILVLTVLDLCI